VKRGMNILRCLAVIYLVLLFVFCDAPYAAEIARSYVLGPGDVLEIHAWNDTNSDILIVNPIPPGITTAYADPHVVTVSRDGRLYIPMIGTIDAANLTLDKLENILKEKLEKFATAPSVSVLIKVPKGIKVNIAGEVAKPGLYEVPDGNLRERTVLNYLKLAGGATLYAGLDQVSIVRGTGDKVTVDLRKLVSNQDVSQNITLNDGDTVIVPQATNQIYVLGQVENPGPQKFIEGASVSDYVGMAGGLKKLAASDSIGIVRGSVGRPKVIKVSLNEYINWDKEEAKLMEGDIIYVPQSWFANWADISMVVVGVRDGRDAARDLATPSKWEAK